VVVLNAKLDLGTLVRVAQRGQREFQGHILRVAIVHKPLTGVDVDKLASRGLSGDFQSDSLDFGAHSEAASRVVVEVLPSKLEVGNLVRL